MYFLLISLKEFLFKERKYEKTKKWEGAGKVKI